MLLSTFFLLLTLQKSFCDQNSTSNSSFTAEYEWNYINFTWKTPEVYSNAIQTQLYIPENNFMVGVKYYNGIFYIAMPRVRKGAPATLGYFHEKNDTNIAKNVLLTPFPDWNQQNSDNCEHLQNVQSMEIDENGTMWVLDGTRFGNGNKCPPKIVLFDLNKNNEQVQSFEFPNEVCLHQGGFLNDLVVDGDFAYISDTSHLDPGLVVFSRSLNRTWKIRDDSMKAEREFSVDGQLTQNVPIDGIALSKKSQLIYFCALNGLSLYSIPTNIVQDESLSRNVTSWVKLVGVKDSQSDGLAVDNAGNLYFGLLTRFGIAKWNTNEPFSTAQRVDSNQETMNWPDSFAFDGLGNLYVLTNQVNKFFNVNNKVVIGNDAKFRLLKLVTGTNSYLY